MSSLIQPDELAAVLPDVTVLDVRYQLGRADGHEQYLAGHVPGAVYVDLATDLADPPATRSTSADGTRCPDPDRFADGDAAGRRAARDRPVVVYDDWSSMAATRAWWLLTLPRAPRRAGARRRLVGVDPAGGARRDGRACRPRHRATSGPTRATCRSSTRTGAARVAARRGAARRPGRRAVPRRGRAGRPGRRPRPRRRQPADRGEPRRRPLPVARRAAPTVYAVTDGRRARSRRTAAPG